MRDVKLIIIFLIASSFAPRAVTSSNEFKEQEANNQIIFQSQLIQEKISITVTEAMEETDAKICITEKGLDLKHLVMAQTGKFKEETFQECVRFCMNTWPNYTHVLVSYYQAFLVGDQFNCMCATKDAIANATSVPEGNCRYQCPQSKYRCGDAKRDLLSVYCIHRSCQQASEVSQPVCSKRLPHDIHGCLKGDLLNWEHAHNVRNFTSSINEDTACIWECKDNHPRSMYALTRVIGQVMTCSCAYGQVLEPDLLVQPEFCQMIDQDTEKSNYYLVSCVSDLDSNGGPITNSSERCDDVTAVGCIFEDLVLGSNPHEFSLKFGSSADPGKDVDVNKCVLGCAALFPTESYFAGVRWDGKAHSLNCWCLSSEAFNASTLGPDVSCHQNCGPENAGLHCGAEGNEKQHRALSLYCIPEEEEEKPSMALRTLVKRDVSMDDSLLEDYLSKMENALRYSNVTTEVVIGLLTALCLVLLSAVLYLWLEKGISSLSRQVM